MISISFRVFVALIFLLLPGKLLAQNTNDLDPITIERLLGNTESIADKLEVLASIIAELESSPNPDLALYFDLSVLRLELLTESGETQAAAELAAQLAQIAVAQRTVLGKDPLPYLNVAAELLESNGQYQKALAILKLELGQRLEGGQWGEPIAGLHRARARVAELQGNEAGAKQFLAFAEAALKPLSEERRAPNQDGFSNVEVYYATDRSRVGKNRPSNFYGYKRGELEYGVVTVSIPATHLPSAIETPSIWKLEFGAEPTKHIMVQKDEPYEHGAYFARMRAEMATRDRQEAFVLVHGFNTNFDAAAKRTAQLAYDMDYRGVPVLYSWPSVGRTFSYITDTAVVRLSGRRLLRFLRELSTHSGAETIHIIAHSMGNRALTDALELFAVQVGAGQETEPAFGQILFAAPDVDSGLFNEMVETISPLAHRMTLYTSSQDRALAISRKLHGDLPRAGQAGSSILISGSVDTIDMSALGEDLLAHTYFADGDSARADIMSLFWLDPDPDNRCGLRRINTINSASVWTYEREACPGNIVVDLIKILWNKNSAGVDDVNKLIESRVADPKSASEIKILFKNLLAKKWK